MRRIYDAPRRRILDRNFAISRCRRMTNKQIYSADACQTMDAAKCNVELIIFYLSARYQFDSLLNRAIPLDCVFSVDAHIDRT